MPDNMRLTGVWDNHKRGQVGDFLRGKIRPGSKLSFVSAYFTIYAYAAMRETLEGADSLRFLFGEPRFVRNLDPEKTDRKAFDIEDARLQLRNRLEQRRVAADCADWIRRKAEIRSVRWPGFLHGKMYHIDNAGVQEALLGSSNFTVSGLGGAGRRNNIELNLEVNDNRDRRDLLDWFNEIWDDPGVVEDVKDEVLRYLEQLYASHSPEFIYFKTLYHLFEDYLKDAEKGGLLDAKTGFFETEVWAMLYDFQKDGVKGAINKILKHNGCIVADSVGLGKTFEALAVIKYFELRNERVLVLCPKKLEDNWRVYRENDTRNPLLKDGFAYTVMAHTDLGRACHDTHHWGNYGLVVIDESHNFRNNTPGGHRDDGSKRLTRYEFLMEKVLRQGIQTKTLLLSATPVNNNLRDLRNQLYLVTANRDDAFRDSLGVHSLAQTMQTAQTRFTNWADPKRNPGRQVARLLDALDASFFKLLDELTIARSRKHIVSYYGAKPSSVAQASGLPDENVAQASSLPDRNVAQASCLPNILSKQDACATVAEGFPERLKVIARSPVTDLKGYFPTYDELNELIKGYKLTIFNPSAYLEDKHVNLYIKEGQLALFNDQKQREFYLSGMPQEGEIDVLIATDCISEGQNLQDCDYLVNYDIHWNPVRIIQRFGRIDRLGSVNRRIQLVNFWPTPDLNKYINLKDRVEARMALVDIAATGADNLLDPDQLRDLVQEELTYRERQLLRLRDEVIDLEDMDDNVSLSEFTLDDFRIELTRFLDDNRKRLEDAPLGLYALAPTPESAGDPGLFDRNWHEIVKPGVVFCLRHKNPPVERSSSQVNPLGAYYLLYLRDDGAVRFNFTQAKNTLGLFQKLCAGRREPYQALCDLFDSETDHGRDMRQYDALLGKAIASIAAAFRKRVAAGLQSGRDFIIPDQTEQAKDDQDFELITWLVIKGA